MVDTQLEDDETPLLQEVNWNGLEEILDEGKYLEDVSQKICNYKATLKKGRIMFLTWTSCKDSIKGSSGF